MIPTLSLSLFLTALPLISAYPSPHANANAHARSSPSSSNVIKRGYTQLKRRAPAPESFEVVGNSGVSAQMMFYPGLGSKVYILDKAENNALTITDSTGRTHPAWGVSYDVDTNEFRTMDVESNTFCAGGMVLGNGTWAVFGGNQPVTYGGVAVTDQGAYSDTDGGAAIRILDPCADDSCEYVQGTQTYTRTDTGANIGNWLQMTSNRWYPTVEGLEDGSLIVIGGDNNGGYVNTVAQDNPTYEFFPRKGDGNKIHLQFLADNLPVNLYPLTYMLPSGNLFMQAGWNTITYNWQSQTVTTLPGMPHAVRVYPASGGNAMLPLTPANNYTATIVFCGGSNPPQWGDDGGAKYNVTAVPADNSCVRISPDDPNPQYSEDDYLPQGRSMGQFVYLPDGKLWFGNGVAMGTAGYGDEIWSNGQSYGQEPIYQPGLYDPSAPSGSRWNWNLSWSTQERMYHSTAVLLKDGSLLISGSNPNADVTNTKWGTSYSVERWYPSWYNEARPGNSDLPNILSYGGDSFNITLNTTEQASVESAKVVIIRGGFSTHAVQWGQRYLELETSYLINMETGSSTLYVSQMPPNPAIFTPGPALIFLVVDGVPSEGQYVMIGSGAIGDQPISTATSLPTSSVYTPPTTSTEATPSATSVSQQNSKTGAAGLRVPLPSSAMGSLVIFGVAAALFSMQ